MRRAERPGGRTARASLATLLLLFLSTAAPAWVRQSAAGADIDVWTASDDTRPYLMVRVETQIDAPVLPLLHLLQDASAQRHWLAYAQDAEVLEQPAPARTLVRFRGASRWPLAPREAVTLFVVSRFDERSIRIDMLNQPDAVPPDNRFERIRRSEGYWLLMALPGCRTHVRYEAGNDWGGSAPRWFVDRLNVRMARQSLQNLREWAPGQVHRYATADPPHEIALHRACD